MGSPRQAVTSALSSDVGRLTFAERAFWVATAEAPAVSEMATAADTTAINAAASAPPVRRDIVPLDAPVGCSDAAHHRS